MSLREEERSPEDPLKSSLDEPLRPSGQTSISSSHACEFRRETSMICEEEEEEDEEDEEEDL